MLPLYNNAKKKKEKYKRIKTTFKELKIGIWLPTIQICLEKNRKKTPHIFKMSLSHMHKNILILWIEYDIKYYVQA